MADRVSKEKKKKSVLGDIVFTICILFLAFAIYFTLHNANDPDGAFIMGYKPSVIKSDSMAPALYVNSLIIARQVPYSSVENNDIIVFKTDDGKYICHRVKEVTAEGFITKGDNNRSDDPMYVTESHFKGKVIFHTNVLVEFFAMLEAPTFGGVVKYIVLPLAVLGLLIVLPVLLRKEKKEESDEDVDSEEKQP